LTCRREVGQEVRGAERRREVECERGREKECVLRQRGGREGRAHLDGVEVLPDE
jgi:hypothetical protein